MGRWLLFSPGSPSCPRINVAALLAITSRKFPSRVRNSQEREERSSAGYNYTGWVADFLRISIFAWHLTVVDK